MIKIYKKGQAKFSVKMKPMFFVATTFYCFDIVTTSKQRRFPVGKIAEKQSAGEYFWQYGTVFWVPN